MIPLLLVLVADPAPRALEAAVVARAGALHHRVSPGDAGALARAAARWGRRYAVPAVVLVAGVEVESGYSATAESGAGCRGWAQFGDATATWVAGKIGIPADVRRPAPAVRMQAWYIRYLSHRYGGLRRGLAAYNAGPDRIGSGAVYADAVLARAGGVVRSLLTASARSTTIRRRRTT